MRSIAACLVIIGAGCAAQRSSGTGDAAIAPQVVILVRHAEKANETDQDPSLSPIGRARAAALADVLRDAGVSRVVVTHRRRTGETAEPLTTRLRIAPDTIPFGRNIADHVKEVARRIRAIGGTTLVVGHSNTIPAIVTELTGVPLPDLCDGDYSTLFVVALPVTGPGRLIRSRFGALDGTAAECGRMAPPR
jgi:phosphohistidine phosphatase SixA